MENIARNNTPATEAAGELLTRIALDPANDERYPDGTVLIPADSLDTSVLIARAIGEHRPIALVFPDGSDVLARPPARRGLARLCAGALVRIADRLLRTRDRPSFVPREWVTEFHAARVVDGPSWVA
jgi:hypothetical protein